MATLWFMIVLLMVAAYVVLDGFDLGAGVIYLGAAKTPDERRNIMRAIGPVWDGNEVCSSLPEARSTSPSPGSTPPASAASTCRS